MIASRGTSELLSACIQQLNHSSNPSVTLNDKMSPHCLKTTNVIHVKQKEKPRTREVNRAVPWPLSEARPKQHLFHYDCFQLSSPPSPANKMLEVFFWKEKTYILIVHSLKIIMSLWLISRDTFLFPTCIGVNGAIYFWAPWIEGPVHSTLKTAIPGLATEHWWIAEVGTAPGGVFTNPTLYFTVYDPTTATPRPSLLFLW